MSHSTGPADSSLRCGCGALVDGDPTGFGRPRLCPSCNVPFKIIWAYRPGTREKAPLVLRAGASSAVRMPSGGQEVVCPCGQPLVARADQRTKPVRCPVCGRVLRLEERKDGAASLRAVVPNTPPAKKSSFAGEDLLCLCGESLRVGAEHLGRRAQCPRCGAVVQLEREQDPQTGQTRVRPKFLSKPEEGASDRWSLEDFK